MRTALLDDDDTPAELDFERRSHAQPRRICPDCGGTAWAKLNGHTSRYQRLRCKRCGHQRDADT